MPHLIPILMFTLAPGLQMLLNEAVTPSLPYIYPCPVLNSKVFRGYWQLQVLSLHVLWAKHAWAWAQDRLFPRRVLHPSEQPKVFNPSKLLWTERFLEFPSNNHERSESRHGILGLIKEKKKGEQAGRFHEKETHTRTHRERETAHTCTEKERERVNKMETSFLTHLWNSFWINELGWAIMTVWCMFSGCCWLIGKVMNSERVKNSKRHGIINGQHTFCCSF